ncbi:MAG: penicillin-binding protein 2 [Rothia sp. (in: high G+C Gram-positive bacteria)]|uniref:peptidoglycan D,D-transpeptidase FtsI family protein n=1 Tax=Rothia sp. (in: high G+C Gram-positive bacteria) TaxID=1885016 RepID=UPI0026F863A2|nr:penicillin-binding protein 2 [Rothia sp. (in: high G+C Gram-positive bacteria)]
MSGTEQNEPVQGIKRTVGRRGFIAGTLGIGGLGLVGLRLAWLQGLDPKGLADAAKAQRTRVQTIPALRGEILDINGKVLARSVQRYNITVDQSAVANFKRYTDESRDPVEVTPTELVYELADILEMSDADVKAALDGDLKYKIVKENVTPAIYNKVDALGAPYIYGEILSDRKYPNGQVGGSVVGRFSIIEEAVDGSSGETRQVNNSVGIERTMGEHLAGIDGERIYEISADGIRIPIGDEQNTPAQDGKSVRLTINQDVQYFAQQVVKARAEELKAEWGTAIVMDVRDGSILALADSSTMDPGAERFELADMNPRAITQVFEPGSTEKILTTAAVFEEGIAEPETVYDVPAELEIDQQTITDPFVHPAQKRTVAGIIADSMNTGTVMMGNKLTKEQRYNWLKKFGMGEFTGIELTGESQGLVSDWRDWDIRQQYTVLFGQGVAQSALQTSMIFQAMANKGVMLKPRIIDAVIDTDGTEEVREVAEGTRMVSEKTARKTLQVMEAVVYQGGAKGAQINGYRVAGKTGTAENVGEGSSTYDGWTTSFVGVAPTENPRFLVSVTMHRPTTTASAVGLANTTAQFAQIMEKTLHIYNVPRSTTEPQETPKFAEGHDENG